MGKKKKKKKVKALFHVDKPWEKDWKNMPEFIQKNKISFKKLIIHFKDEEDLIEFSKLVEQRLTMKTKSIWFPEVKNKNLVNKICIDES